MKNKNIERYTKDNLPKGKPNWDKLKSLSEEEINTAAQSDPDNPIWTDDMFASAALHISQKKVSVHMYIDEEVIDWFKLRGKGYQTRINSVLKSYVHKHLHKHS